MKKHIMLAFDMDGTITKTAKLLREEGIREFHKRGMVEAIQYAIDNPEGSTLLWPQYMRDITDEIVREGTFMLRVEPTEIVQQGLLNEIAVIRRMSWNKRLDTCVCTHRGFHDKGVEYTGQWLSQNDAIHVMDNIHAIDPSVHPNKLKFLEEVYPDHEIRLLDDNPLFRTDVPHEYDERLCIVSEEGVVPGYANQNQFPGVYTFARNIRDMLLA